MRTRRLPTASVALLLLLAACGGASAPPAPPPPIPPGVDVTAVAAADPGSALPATWLQGPFMEIYVRGYKDSNGDGVGDLQGLTQQLGYLADLGVTGLWLMPIHASQDHDHGYAVTDYRGLEAAYGTEADLDALLAQAHALGIGVIIDYVMNHSARTNPLFTASANAAPGGWRDWYLWSDTAPVGWSYNGGNPWRATGSAWYYAPFWDQMPDFNLRNPAVVDYHHDNLRLWLNRGVDGFRFDAVGMLVENGPLAWSDQPENYLLMGDVKILVGGYAQRFMVCEDPGSAAAFAACGAAFDFGHASNLQAAAQGNAAALGQVGADFAGMTAATAAGHATFLANHDSFTIPNNLGRVADLYGGDEAKERVAAALYLLGPGTPFIYYGEELGMTGASTLTGDWRIRPPMSWTGDPARAGFTTGTPFRARSANVTTHNVAAEAGQPGSLLTWYKALIALRRSLPALAAGDLTAPQVLDGPTLAFQRSAGAAHALVVVNAGLAAATVTVASLPAGATLTGEFPAATPEQTVAGDGTLALTVPAAGVLVYGW